MVDIFDEVEDDLRAERSARLLKKYAWVIITLAVIVVGAAIGWQLWSRWQTSRDMAAAQQYLAAQVAADGAGKAAAMTALEQQAATGPDGYRTLARLRAAALKANGGDLPGAVALWDQVAGDTAADPLFRDLASLLATQHQLDHGDPAALEARLKPLTAANNPWSALAREQLAFLDLRQGKLADAKAALRRLSIDIGAPTGVRQRTAAILAGLGGE